MDGGEELSDNVGMLVARIIICAVGLVGNTLVMFVILVLKEYEKAITHWYVLQLAIADFCFLLTLPFQISEGVHDAWIFSGTLCKMKESLLFINYYASMLFLTVMSIDRYIAVCRVFDSKLQRLRKKLSAYIITAAIWIVSVLFSIPLMIISDKRGIEPHCHCSYDFSTPSKEDKLLCDDEDLSVGVTFEECMQMKESACLTVPPAIQEILDGYYYDMEANGSRPGDDSDLTKYYGEDYIGDDEVVYERGCSYHLVGRGFMAFILFDFIVMFVLPFVLMSICYTLIALRLRDVRNQTVSITRELSTASDKGFVPPERSGAQSVSSNKAEKKSTQATFLCLVLVVLFVICWLPFHVAHLAKIHGISGKSSRFCMEISFITSVIVYLNSALNPYVYNFIGTKFGKRLKAAWRTLKELVRRRFSTSSGSARYSRGQSNCSADISNGGTISLRLLGENTTTKHEFSGVGEPQETSQPTKLNLE